MLQYLDYEKERSWKRCPLCFDSVYKLDLKHVVVRKSNHYREGQVIKFDLMVRSRANTLVKNKYLESQLFKRIEEVKSKLEKGEPVDESERALATSAKC